LQGAEAQVAEGRELELLAAFATTGQLPWWASRQDARLIPAALESALALPPEVLAAWWRQAVPETTARQRLLAAAEPEQAARLRQLLGEVLEMEMGPGMGMGMGMGEAVGMGMGNEKAPLASAPSPSAGGPGWLPAQRNHHSDPTPSAGDIADPKAVAEGQMAVAEGARRAPEGLQGAEAQVAESRELELLAAFATTGQLPWWASRQDARLIPAALESALALPPEVLAAWWRQAVPQTTARQRLLAAAEPEQAARLRQLLGEALGMGIGLGMGMGMGNQQAPLASAPSPSAGGPGWLPAQSHHHSVPSSSAADIADPKAVAEGPMALTEGARRHPDGVQVAEAQGEEGRELELLAAFATTGQLPWWAPRQDARLIPAALESALALPPEVVAAWWHQAVPQTTARQRLLAAAKPEQAARLRELLGEVLAQHQGGAEGVVPEAPLDREPLDMEAPATQPPLSPSPALPPASALALQAATNSTGRRPEGRPSQPDEPLTVDGAGLVMLSPFLETLFQSLGWLTPERRFLGLAEQQRAVVLLGFLVNGDANPPEWRLTLAKLLCGQELEALCSLEAPLDEVEQAEGEALLQAALAHGQGLLGDEIGPLREQWLQRPALLSWRPGAWLLVVERRQGDEAVEELPWSWGWIRLPWMEELLQVVW
jgi:uncharacterized membrane protein